MKTINVTIEIPKKTNVKYEYDRKTKEVCVDRILFGTNVYPQNYGFIKEALDYDGDELDCLVIADQSFSCGIKVPTRILGAMEMIDDGETDTKLIGVIDCDPRYASYKTLNDVPNHCLKEIKDFFQNYKNLQNKKVIVKDFKSTKWAEKEYDTCVKLMKKYGSLEKDEFIAKMHKLHPEKYC